LIVELDWTEDALKHIERHIDPGLVDELFDANDYYAWENRNASIPDSLLVIGRCEHGNHVTAIILAIDRKIGIWRPITAWGSTRSEREQFSRYATLDKGRAKRRRK